MHKISDYLNIIGDFTYNTESGTIPVLGVLERKEQDTNCFFLRARIPVSEKQSIDAISFNLYGVINNMEISLLNCFVKNMSYNSTAEYINVVIELDRIVIGGHYHGTASIQCVSAYFPALNYFFTNRVNPFSDGNYREEYFISNPPLNADTQFGHVSIQSFLTFTTSFKGLNIRPFPFISYSFKEAKTLDSAIAHVASLRNLFTFFADGYIDLYSLEFSTNANTIPSHNGDEMTVILNRRDAIPEIVEPFLLTRTRVEDDFQTIIENWLEFYQNSIYIPSLFFEVITNRSKGINEFLNLAQAVEIYSSYFRNEPAKEICNNDPDAEIKDKPSLKHRLIDIFSYLQNTLNISDEQRDGLARSISKNRNFYTHFSSKGKEPSYITVSRMIVFLRFVILALVYKHVGVNDQAIQFCKSLDVYKTMNESIRIIIANEHQSKMILD